MEFKINLPTKVFFGEGTSYRVGDFAKELSAKKVLLITGKNSVESSGALDRVSSGLNKNGIEWQRFSGVTSNPDTSLARSVIELVKKESFDLLISVGGGSALDLGKAVSLGAKYDGDILDLFENTKVSESIDPLPHIAVPTTAGTGSECSKGAILSHEISKIKGGIRGDNVFPLYAIVDPELTYSMGHAITAESGFDALAHAFETYFSLAASPYTDALAEYAMKNIFQVLPLLIHDLKNKELRNKMSYSSMLMGINLSHSSTCLPHRLQYSMAALVDVTHAQGLALFYETWINKVSKVAQHKAENINGIVGENYTKALLALMGELGLKKNLRDFVQLSDLQKIEKGLTGNLKSDPIMNADEKGISDFILESYSISE